MFFCFSNFLIHNPKRETNIKQTQKIQKNKKRDFKKIKIHSKSREREREKWKREEQK